MPSHDADHKLEEKDLKDLKDPEKYIVKPDEGTLYVKKFTDYHAGEYKCYVGSKSQTIKVMGEILI